MTLQALWVGLVWMMPNPFSCPCIRLLLQRIADTFCTQRQLLHFRFVNIVVLQPPASVKCVDITLWHMMTHGVRTFRMHVPNPASHMKHGLPICKHCNMNYLEKFYGPAWLPGTPFAASCTVFACQFHWDVCMPPIVDTAVRGQVVLLDSDLEHLRQLKFGPRLLTLVVQQRK